MFSIADLIIHEQTHATVFLKGQIQFNEELATFVGWEGALDFIRRRWGEDSEELREARAALADSQTYFSVMLELHGELERLYVESRKAGVSRAEILRGREEMFEAFRRSFPERRPELFASEAFRNMKAPPLNNAYLMSFVRYGQDLDLFYELHRSTGGDLARTVAVVKELADVKTDPKAFLRERIAKP
jgi:predicted aminopeptidase